MRSLSTLSVVVMLLVASNGAHAQERGRSECYTRQDLSARANGFISRIIASDGQTVKTGDVLAELDNRLHKAAVREAKAGVAAAKANVELASDGHERLKKMAGTDTVSAQELFAAEVRLDQAKAQLEAAQAAHDRACIMLDDTYIKAEIDGRVSGLPQVKNLFVQAGQSLGRVEAAASACAVSK